jgi:hypothetical protein
LSLVNVMLDSLPVYAMGAVQLPPGVIDVLDVRRRAFLWAGEDSVSGAQCLVSWNKACLPKKEGGLGIRDLRLQNTCLLLKLIHRAHDAENSAWSHWLEMEFGGLINCPYSTKDGVHLASLQRLLPDYWLLTTVEVGDGRSTSFWHDCWTASRVLSVAFPALYTHARRGKSSVCSMLGLPLRHTFIPRLSSVAEEELVALSTLMADVTLVDVVNVHRYPWENAAGKLSSSVLYNAIVSTRAVCEYYKFVWEKCTRPKGWLLLQDRIQTKRTF